jgi:hypothetical protein
MHDSFSAAPDATPSYISLSAALHTMPDTGHTAMHIIDEVRGVIN